MKTSHLTHSPLSRSPLSRSHWAKGPSAFGIASLALLLSLGACRKDEKKADSKATTDTSAPGAKKAKPVDEGIEVPTEEDFEDAVAKQITPESDLQKELDQLDREISGAK